MPASELSNDLETLPFLREAVTPSPVLSPEAHWASTVRAFAESGGVVSGDELAELLRQHVEGDDERSQVQPVSLVARWIVTRSVVTLDGPWERMLPLFQFDLPHATVHEAMRPLLPELRGAFEDTELAMWFVTGNDWLAGACPAQVMHTDLNAVRQAARSDRFVAVGF